MKSLYFQFSDGPIELQHAQTLSNGELLYVVLDSSLEYLPIYSFVEELWETWKGSDSGSVLLNRLAGALRWRSTSVAADEALCLATLAGFDMDRIVDLPPEDRLRGCWDLVPRFLFRNSDTGAMDK